MKISVFAYPGGYAAYPRGYRSSDKEPLMGVVSIVYVNPNVLFGCLALYSNITVLGVLLAVILQHYTLYF